MEYPDDLTRHLTLLDGRTVLARAVLPEDEAELRRAVAGADPDTLHRRFLGGRPPTRDEDFRRLVCVDYDRRLAVVALAPDGTGVGIARYEAIEGTDAAEVAVAVDPAWRSVGLATALLRLLGEAAVTRGIRHLRAEFFADNQEVADLLAEESLPYQESRDGSGTVTVDVTLPAAPVGTES